MAAIVAVYAALGGSIPAWVVWALVALAFYVAGFYVWRETKHEAEKLELIIRDADKTSEIKNALGTFITKGSNLFRRSFKESGDSFITECKTWDSEVVEFLGSKLNGLAVPAFSHPDFKDVNDEIKHPTSRTLDARTRALRAIALSVASFVKPLTPVPDKAT